MLDQHVIHARKIVAEYKKYNENTIERVVRRENSKTVYFERVQTDENASKFTEKLLKDSQAEKKDKRLNKVQKSGPKTNIVKPREPRQPRAEDPEVKAAYLQRQKKIYEMSVGGMTKNKIASELKLSIHTISTQLAMYRKAHGIEYVRESYRKSILEMKLKGCSNDEIMEKLGCVKSAINYHVDRLAEEYPELKTGRKYNKGILSKETLVMKELFEQGYPMREIRAITGRAQSTLSRNLKVIREKMGAKWTEQVKKAKKERNFQQNYKS